MFLNVLRRRNPALVEAAIALHQAGRIPANCYVLDLDAVEANARVFKERADALGLTVFAMTKQVGRNSGFCRALQRGGIDRAVAVDMACARPIRAAGMRVGHLGHLVQVPRFEADAAARDIAPDFWTVFSGAKASEAAAAAKRAGRTQELLARIQAPGDTFYRGHEGGFDAADIATVAAELDALAGARFAGITTFPALLYDHETGAVSPTPNLATLNRAREALEHAGYAGIKVNAPGTTSSVVLEALAGAGATQCEPGNGLHGTTPLHVAVVRGHAGLAGVLLEHGADPNADGPGYTALHWAAGSWHTELTGRLRGIDTDGDPEWRSLNGVRAGRLALLDALLAHGADPDVRLGRHPPQFGFASQRFRVSLLGATPFLLAAMDGNVEVMRRLAAAGADTRAATDENNTPLMVAAGLGQVPAETRVTGDGALEAVELVLALGADVNAVNLRGRSALYGAAHIRSDAIVKLLVDRGARVNLEDDRGITPLMVAEGGGHILLPGLGGGSTADLLRSLGSDETVRSSFIENFSQGAIR